MAGLLHETPSRVLRRMNARDDADMPSLPSLPVFEDFTADHDLELEESELSEDLCDIPPPLHSTPTATSIHHTVASTIRPSSSTSSTARFANSIASRSNKSSSQGPASSRNSSSMRGYPDSFDISRIPSLPNISAEPWTGQYSEDEETDSEPSRDSMQGAYLSPNRRDDGDEIQDASLSEALQSLREDTSSPYPTEAIEDKDTPKKYYEYSIGLKSESKPSPFDKYRNVAMRKTSARMRTPSLTRTTSSRATSPGNSTPHSARSLADSPSNSHSPLTPSLIPLPRSNTASPAVQGSHLDHNRDQLSEDIDDHSSRSTDVRSMDITEVHISPVQIHNSQSYSDSEELHREQDIHASVEEKDVTGSEQEPTFSSEEGVTPYAQTYTNLNPTASHSLVHLSSVISSPSVAFTPTPAFPRPRARFNLPVPSDLLDTPDRPEPNQPSDEAQEEDQEPEEPLTPSRRRSFLLSVINSTTRPRLKFPTPHPRSTYLATPSIAESTPGPGISAGPRTSLHTAFAGVTPRPRPAIKSVRTSHPLSQTIAQSPGTSDSESVSAASASVSRVERRQSWAPASGNPSPYDGVNDLASFVSTASSHDLTTHHRVNTSFDPSMGFGAGANQGAGRFNTGKLNNYLHGLNRRLQEENEALIERLRRAEEEKKSNSAELIVHESGRRVSLGSKRVSTGGMTLGDVVEDVGAEGWGEEKLELEDFIESLKGEKETLEKILEDEREARMKDKEGWKQRMIEVEEGVSEIIKDLEGKVEVAEKQTRDVEERNSQHTKELEKRLIDAEAERAMALDRAEKADRVLESGKELGGELKDANGQIAKLNTELRSTQKQMNELEEEVMQSDHKIDDLEKDLRADRDTIANLEAALTSKDSELVAEKERARQVELEAQQLEQELESIRTQLAEMEDGAVSAIERIEGLEDELGVVNDRAHALTLADEEARDKIQKLEGDAQKAQQFARQMEEALEEAKKKMLADDDELDDLKRKLISAERERHRETNITQESVSTSDVGATNADIEALEDELDAANREIARLNTLLSQSPARKAVEKARDAKVGLLEREKEELLERNKALRMAMNEISTPSKIINTSGISPIHRQVLSMSIRAPRTPGAPLRDMTWLNNTTDDPTVSPLLAEISRLQRELDIANDSIDDKLDKLEDAGLGVVGLTKKLEDARTKISTLEDEIARLLRRDDRRNRCFERARCQKCRIKINFSNLLQADDSILELSKDDLPSEPPTPATKTSEALRADLQSVNTHLESLKKKWEQERRTLLGDKAVLQDATNRLGTEVRIVKEEMKKVAESERAGGRTVASIQGELDKAKRAITDLEANLKSERTQLRTLTTKQNSVEREKADIISHLQRTESDMEDVKKHLQRYKKENHDLEKELSENANAEQRARLLEGRVAENAATIENLRQERSLLATDHKELQRRFSDISEEAERLRAVHSASSTSHDNRRHQLDLHRLEIDDLRNALSGQADELQKAEQEKKRISAEKKDVARTVAALEADLRRVKKDAEAFGRDLKILRAEKEKQEEKDREELSRLERTKKQAHAQIRLLNEQLEEQRQQTNGAREKLKNHVCAADEGHLLALKVRHNKECKGLMVQMRYLKAKFTRESSFRDDLAYQKQHLLVLLTQFEKSEQTIFAAIARIGFPVAAPPLKRPRKLKSVVLAVVFLRRATHASTYWREHIAARQSVTDALQDVRRHRAQSS